MAQPNDYTISFSIFLLVLRHDRQRLDGIILITHACQISMIAARDEEFEPKIGSSACRVGKKRQMIL